MDNHERGWPRFRGKTHIHLVFRFDELSFVNRSHEIRLEPDEFGMEPNEFKMTPNNVMFV